MDRNFRILYTPLVIMHYYFIFYVFLEMTYVPQENIEVIKNTKILHPSVEDYFENFDGSQYLPRPWLKTVYPRD